MIKYFLVFTFLISLIFCSYLPMSSKKHNFGDNICFYYDHEDDITYVKPCESGKYCHNTEGSGTRYTIPSSGFVENYIRTCQTLSPNIKINPTSKKYLDETCDQNSDCISGLYCGGSPKKCLSYCNNDENTYLIDGSYICKNKKLSNDKCYLRESAISKYYSYNIEDYQVCGEIDFVDTKDSNNIAYKVASTIKINYFGSQKDGTWVYTEEACTSGTALYFYPDGKLTDVTTGTTDENNEMYLRCVTIKEIDRSTKIFTYVIDGSEETYQVIKVDKYNSDFTIQSHLDGLYNRLKYATVEIWKNLWKDYLEVNTKYYYCQEDNAKNNQQNTCIDDDYRRKVFFYKYSEDYLLYKDQTEVIEFLIQQKFPDYSPIINAPVEEEEGGFLKMKYIILALILLFFK